MATQRSEQGTSGPRRTRVDPRRARTRARLLEAASELAHSEGIAGLSVSAVTRRVGVHQSLFYRHFDSLEACLAEAGRELVARIAPVDRTLRRSLGQSASFDSEGQASFFEAAFARWLEAGPLAQLLVLHRADPSPFGRAFRPLVQEVRDEVASELWERLAPLGLDGSHLQEVHLLADQLVAGYHWALELLIEGRARDRRGLAEHLAETNRGILHAAVQRMLGGGAVGRRDALSAEARSTIDDDNARLRQLLATHDDAQLPAALGAPEALVDAALAGMCQAYLPSRCTRPCEMRLHVALPGQPDAVRTLRMDRGGCAVLPAGTEVAPELEQHLSLRALLELVAGELDLFHRFSRGELRLSGDRSLALIIPEWFYRPRPAELEACGTFAASPLELTRAKIEADW